MTENNNPISNIIKHTLDKDDRFDMVEMMLKKGYSANAPYKYDPFIIGEQDPLSLTFYKNDIKTFNLLLDNNITLTYNEYNSPDILKTIIEFDDIDEDTAISFIKTIIEKRNIDIGNIKYSVFNDDYLEQDVSLFEMSINKEKFKTLNFLSINSNKPLDEKEQTNIYFNLYNNYEKEKSNSIIKSLIDNQNISLSNPVKHIYYESPHTLFNAFILNENIDMIEFAMQSSQFNPISIIRNEMIYIAKDFKISDSTLNKLQISMIDIIPTEKELINIYQDIKISLRANDQIKELENLEDKMQPFFNAIIEKEFLNPQQKIQTNKLKKHL